MPKQFNLEVLTKNTRIYFHEKKYTNFYAMIQMQVIGGKIMSREYEFLKECGYFYVLTINKDFPDGRPFGAVMEAVYFHK